MTAAQVRNLVEGAAMGSPVSPIVANLFWIGLRSQPSKPSRMSSQSGADTWKLWWHSVTVYWITSQHTSILTTRRSSSHRNRNMMGPWTCSSYMFADLSMASWGSVSSVKPPTRTSISSCWVTSPYSTHCESSGSASPMKTICSSEEDKFGKKTTSRKSWVCRATRSVWVTATKPKAPTIPQDPSTTWFKGSTTFGCTSKTLLAEPSAELECPCTSHLTTPRHLVQTKDKVPKDDFNVLVTWRRDGAVATTWRRWSDGRRKLLHFTPCCKV